jgi:cold shock protein
MLVVFAIHFELLDYLFSKEKTGMSTGTVKFFNEEKGFGFILQDDGGKDLFVHASEIQGDRDTTLNEGQKVEYEVGQGKKGPCALNVIPN